MSTGPARYAALLRTPGVGSMILVGIVGRLPLGMVPLAIVLVVRAAGDSYGVAGLAVGAYSLAAAVAVPQYGRLVDRIGQRRVLVPLGLGQPLAVGLLALLADRRVAPAALVAGGPCWVL